MESSQDFLPLVVLLEVSGYKSDYDIPKESIGNIEGITHKRPGYSKQPNRQTLTYKG